VRALAHAPPEPLVARLHAARSLLSTASQPSPLQNHGVGAASSSAVAPHH